MRVLACDGVSNDVDNVDAVKRYYLSIVPKAMRSLVCTIKIGMKTSRTQTPSYSLGFVLQNRELTLYIWWITPYSTLITRPHPTSRRPPPFDAASIHQVLTQHARTTAHLRGSDLHVELRYNCRIIPTGRGRRGRRSGGSTRRHLAGPASPTYATLLRPRMQATDIPTAPPRPYVGGHHQSRRPVRAAFGVLVQKLFAIHSTYYSSEARFLFLPEVSAQYRG